jgi:hypothetical protein
MESLKSFHDHLENLQSQAKKLTETELALNALFAGEGTRLKREDEASSLRALYRTIVEQLERIKYSEVRYGVETLKPICFSHLLESLRKSLWQQQQRTSGHGTS